MKIKLLYSGLVACLLAYVMSCKTIETEDFQPVTGLPANPYDTLTYPPLPEPVQVDSASFVGLHAHLFSKACNRPGCHDGSFEPDFRSVQSAYNSLVLHGITKNYTGSAALPYRVKPGNKDQSMLWHRVFYHNPPNFERMPSSGNPLSQQHLDKIAAWIDGGARNIYGQAPTMTSLQPTSWGVLAYLPGSSNQRIDTNRGGVLYQPFAAPAGDAIELWFGYLDRTPAGDTVLGDQLAYNRIRLSTNPFDFSGAVELNLTKVPNLLLAKFVNSAFSETVPIALPYTHSVTLTPSALGFQAGDVVYIRTYVRDSDHSQPTEIPQADSQPWLLGYFSMVLQ